MNKKKKQVTIHVAKTNLSKLINELDNYSEVVIAKGKVPVAKLIRFSTPKYKRVLGWGRGVVEIAEDFNEPLKDFEEYM